MIHVIGFPHTRFDDTAFSHCAFTSKVVRWVEMMGDAGEDITLYWGGDEPPTRTGVTDYVALLTDSEQEHFFGPDLPSSILALNWDPSTPHWGVLNHRATAALLVRWSPGDVIAILSGSNHNTLMSEIPQARFVEPWVGYAGISMSSTARIFESSAWRHLLYGRFGLDDGLPLDDVIPNSYRPDDFHAGEDMGYLLFIGRMIMRKGIETVVEIAQRMSRPLHIAGQGARVADSELICDDGTVIDISDVELVHHGVVGPAARAELYAHASCTLAPTRYIEPFGGVFAEAMLSGVMPVTTNWGAFVEYVPDDARFSDITGALEAVEWAIGKRGTTRDYAVERFGTKTAQSQYAEWLWRVRRT